MATQLFSPRLGDPAFFYEFDSSLRGPPRPSRSGRARLLTTRVRAAVPGTRPDLTKRVPRQECWNRVCTSGDEAQTDLLPPSGGKSPFTAATAQSVDEHPRFILDPTLRRAWPRDLPGAAICVQDVDVQCVLQFTLIHAAGCALHRHTSRVIHRLELSFISLQPG